MKLYLGSDVSKGYADWVILSEKKQAVLENFQLDDTYAGHCKLYDTLEAYFGKHRELEIYAAVESTGGYENNWFRTLFYCRISGFVVMPYSRKDDTFKKNEVYN